METDAVPNGGVSTPPPISLLGCAFFAFSLAISASLRYDSFSRLYVLFQGYIAAVLYELYFLLL